MKTQKIRIDYLYFHFVDTRKPTTKLRKGRISNISNEAHEVYAKYIADVVNRSESRKAYDIFEIDTPRAKLVRKEVKSMIRRPIPEESKQFDESALKLANELIGVMKGTSRPGVLFEILFRVGGRRFICFLKLEWVNEAFCEYDEKAHSMSLKQLVEELPASGKFQKGAIYPHPTRPGFAYMRIYQEDAEAHYFEKFLGGMPEVSGYDMMKELRRLTRGVTGEPPTFEQNIGLFQGLESHLGQEKGMVSEADVIRLLQDAIPSESNKAVVDRIGDDIKRAGVIRASQVKDLKMVFYVDRLMIRGSYIDIIETFERRNSDKHIIKGRISGVRMGRR